MKINLGKAINWSEEDLDDWSRITTEDIERAADWWQRNVTKKFKGLLDADTDLTTNSQGTKQQNNTRVLVQHKGRTISQQG